MGFEAGADQTEVTPSGVGFKAGGHDFSCMIICGEDEVLERGGGPPLVRGGIVLEEFARGGRFPAAPGFGAWSCLADQRGIVLLNVLSYRRARAMETKAAAELIGDKGIVEGSG